MAHPLDAALLKLDRAEEHLRAFDHESGDWLEQTNFHEFVIQDDGDQRLFYLHITATPPPRLSAILGDCLQNIRASLDYLAWELVIANGCTPTDRTYFPIQRYAPSAGQKFSAPSLTGVNPLAIAEIEKVQPYYGGQNPYLSWLWFLRELSNTDKHRSINIVVGQAFVESFKVTVMFGNEERVMSPGWINVGEVLHHGAHVASYPLAQFAGGSTQVKMEANTVGFVTLGQALPWGAQPISRYVGMAMLTVRNDVLPRFDRFFSCLGPGF